MENPDNSGNPGNTEEQTKTHETQPKEKINSPEKKGNDNVVFIGSKRLMNYVNSILIQAKNSEEIIVKARGKFISKAVDIVEVAKRQTQEANLTIKEIKIGTEEYENEGKKVKVSTIEIILTK